MPENCRHGFFAACFGDVGPDEMTQSAGMNFASQNLHLPSSERSWASKNVGIEQAGHLAATDIDHPSGFSFLFGQKRCLEQKLLFSVQDLNSSDVAAVVNLNALKIRFVEQANRVLPDRNSVLLNLIQHSETIRFDHDTELPGFIEYAPSIGFDFCPRLRSRTRPMQGC